MFDGVGGFIIGLNNANKKLGDKYFHTVVSNQYEPSRKNQDAFEVGKYHFPDMEHIGKDVQEIDNKKFEDLSKEKVSMIVGGFPCQDYSVARSKKHEMGIEGKKGVLFWEIIRAVNHIKPNYLILENVDRLLKSPSNQRGRDFAIMLGAFNQLGYSVEWRVINAADYGKPQRRRRVFFFVYKNNTLIAKKINKEFEKKINGLDSLVEEEKYDDYIFSTGLFARQFPIEKKPNKKRHFSQNLSELDKTDENYIVDISDNFTGAIWNSGVMRDGKYYTADTIPIVEKCKTLGDVVKQAKNYYVKKYGKDEYERYLDNYYIQDKEKLKKFEYLRGSKKIERTTADGHTWIYSEGGMSPHDKFELPARTMLTSEGSVNRSTHFLKDEKGYRLLTPIEAELLQGFPEEWTRYKNIDNKKIEISDKMRYFFMGNALVTGIVERISIELYKMNNN